jgi:hypothetical protein
MEQTKFPISRNLPLKRLVADALGEIERMGYSRRSRNRYRAIWEHLIEFSGRNELGDEFSEDLATRFLKEYQTSFLRTAGLLRRRCRKRGFVGIGSVSRLLEPRF